jgi:hypothetical protein
MRRQVGGESRKALSSQGMNGAILPARPVFIKERKMYEDVRHMIDNPGVYIAGDKGHPDITIVLVSLGGKIYSTIIDEELNPEGFFETHTLNGPYVAGMKIKEINKELLEACKMMLRLMEGENLDEKFDGEAEILRDAILKAEGGK